MTASRLMGKPREANRNGRGMRTPVAISINEGNCLSQFNQRWRNMCAGIGVYVSHLDLCSTTSGMGIEPGWNLGICTLVWGLPRSDSPLVRIGGLLIASSLSRNNCSLGKSRWSSVKLFNEANLSSKEGVSGGGVSGRVDACNCDVEGRVMGPVWCNLLP